MKISIVSLMFSAAVCFISAPALANNAYCLAKANINGVLFIGEGDGRSESQAKTLAEVDLRQQVSEYLQANGMAAAYFPSFDCAGGVDRGERRSRYRNRGKMCVASQTINGVRFATGARAPTEQQARAMAEYKIRAQISAYLEANGMAAAYFPSLDCE